ncbi:MAG: response regulator [Planctomycetota bacterium]
MVDLKPLNILIVDDDEVDIMAVKRTLARSRIGNAITVARNGLEGLEILRKEDLPEPRLVLLDLNMPGMNGIEFLKELRSDPELSGQPVIVLSTSRDERDRLAAFDLHIKDYLLKEKVQDELVSLLIRHAPYWRIVAPAGTPAA